VQRDPVRPRARFGPRFMFLPHNTPATLVEANLRLVTQTAAARVKDADVPVGLGIIVEVLPRRGVNRSYTSEALSVFQEARAADAQVAVITGHTDRVRSVAFSPDGSCVGSQMVFVDRPWSPWPWSPSPDQSRVFVSSRAPLFRHRLVGQRRIVLSDSTCFVFSNFLRALVIVQTHTCPRGIWLQCCSSCMYVGFWAAC
jgi:hypothetical protein